MTDKEINKKICEMVRDKTIEIDEIIRYVKGDCYGTNLTPQTLGLLFERYLGIEIDNDDMDEEFYFSRVVTIDELKNIHPSFQSTNGCQWARDDNSYLGKKYIIKREKKGGKVYSIQLDGPNDDSIKKYRSINSDIVKQIRSERCAILDIGSNIEVDHKNGRYNTLKNVDINTQKLEDFQPLSKAANDAKRMHCKKCIESGKRYDAKNLGYKESFILGDENTKTCNGCYWYNPKRFNELISKDFKKEK